VAAEDLGKLEEVERVMRWRHMQWMGLMPIVLAVLLIAGCRGNQPLTAKILSPYEGASVCCAGREIAFQGKGEDPEGEELTYEWDFGDGQTSGEKDPVHIYAEPGTYTVTLTVSDGKDTGSDRIVIVVGRLTKPTPLPSAAVYGCLALWHTAGKSLPKDRASWRAFQEFVGQTQALIGGAIQGAIASIRTADPDTSREALRADVIASLEADALSPGMIGQVRQILTDLGIDVSELSDEEVADEFALALADSADNPLYQELLADGLPEIDEEELKEINEEFRRIRVEPVP